MSVVSMKKIRNLVIGLALLVGVTQVGIGEERPEWDQEKAIKTVKAVIALEERGELPWDDINWETDAEKVAKQAEKEQKPIFVFLYLKKDVGPADAPC